MTDFGEGVRRRHIEDSPHVINLVGMAREEIENSSSEDKIVSLIPFMLDLR